MPCPFWHAALICQSVIDRSALVLITGAKMQKHDSISRHIKKKMDCTPPIVRVIKCDGVPLWKFWVVEVVFGVFFNVEKL